MTVDQRNPDLRELGAFLGVGGCRVWAPRSPPFHMHPGSGAASWALTPSGLRNGGGAAD